MLLTSTVSLKVLDKVAQDYDIPRFEMVNGVRKEVGRNTGTSYTLTVKSGNQPAGNIKFPNELISKFNDIPLGKNVDFIFTFETDPQAYNGKDGKPAYVNFNHVPKLVDVILTAK